MTNRYLGALATIFTILIGIGSTTAKAETFDYRLSHAIRAHQVPDQRSGAFLADGPLVFRIVDGDDPRLEILDRSIPGEMVPVGDIVLSRLATSLSKDGDRLYAADAAGLDIIDIGDPAAPAILGSHAVPGTRCASAQGDLLVVTRGFNGASFYDAADPTALSLLSEMPLPAFASIMEFFDGRMVISLGDRGFALIDIADPTTPILLGIQSPNHGFMQFLNVNGLLLVVTSDVGIRFYDPMTGSHATYLTGFDDGTRYWSADATADRVYACGGQQLVDVFDISQLPQLDHLVRHEHLAGARDVALHDDLLLVNLNDQSFAWIEPERVTVAPDTLFTRATEPGFRRLRARDGFLYALASTNYGNNSLRILDVRPGATGEQLGQVPIAGNLARFALQDEFAFVVGTDGVMTIVNIADPENPTRESSIRVTRVANGPSVAVAGNSAVIGFWLFDQGAVVLLDVRDPARPVATSRVELPERVVCVEIWNEHVIAITESEALYVIRMPQPGSPSQGARVIARLELEYHQGMCEDLVVQDDVAWVLGRHDFFVVDLAVPEDPVLLTTWNPLGVNGDSMNELAIRDGLAYITTATASLTVLDVSDPAAISLVGYAQHRDSVGSLAVDASAAYVSHFDGELAAWPLHGLGIRPPSPLAKASLPAPTGPLLAVFPVPANPRTAVHFTLERAQQTKVTIHDLRGARLVTLADGRFAAGDHVLTWSGQLDRGGKVASGMYLVRVACPDGVATRKVALVQ